jgi:sugar phosphate permease
MNMGIAVPNFIPDKGERGIVLSAFFYGYICTQIPAGLIAARIGVKSVLALGVVVWTICDASTTLASRSLWPMVLVRAGVGCGEGVVMSSLHIFSANWFPMSEQTTLVALVTSGSDLGTILSLLLSPWLVKVTDQWQTIFLVTSAFTMILLSFYMKHVTSKPEEHPNISKQEKDMIVSARRSTSPAKLDKIPWYSLLTNRYLWVIYTSHFSSTYAWYVLLGWLPTYLSEQLGLDLKQHQLTAATPYICGYIGLLTAGKFSDFLINRGFRTLYVRRCMNCIGSFVPAILLYVLPFAKTPTSAIFFLSGALFAGRACTSGFWINMIDVGPEYAGQIMGVSNSIGTIPGIFGNVITGLILKQTQSWQTVFHLAAFVCAVGGVVFGCFSTDRDVFKKHKIGEDEQNEEGNDLLFNTMVT